ncbi:MAG TPA: type I phosphomannose isomerase catalytic subunit [Chthoniobacterales bacterium]
MQLTEPIFFEPLFMERVWGGSRLQALFGKHLPTGSRIGESWEIVDREEAQSVVHEGPLRGSTLQELWVGYRADIFGKDYIAHPSPRFPLLVKLLDAQERLSVQVHPPANIAPVLGGEPKTEMWYIVDTQLDHAIFAGLQPGTTRESFQEHLEAGTVEEVVKRIPVAAGDAIFIQSGRLHAIGAGNVIVEVQQNSDTTYRVFDWNRVGLDGEPRTLHVEESLQSIDYSDTDPQLAPKDGENVVACEYFKVEKWELDAPRLAESRERFSIVTVLSGRVECGGKEFAPGEFFLVPALQPDKTLHPMAEHTTLLHTTIPV